MKQIAIIGGSCPVSRDAIRALQACGEQVTIVEPSEVENLNELIIEEVEEEKRKAESLSKLSYAMDATCASGSNSQYVDLKPKSQQPFYASLPKFKKRKNK
jgi:siroheme synthase (precorrin-2 oxidase/ferrochelatase)